MQKLAVRNVSSNTQTVSPPRVPSAPRSRRHGSVTLNTATAPTYIDQFGIPRSYVEQDFTVPANKDRLDVSFATPRRRPLPASS